MTYNVHRCVGVDRVRSTERVADVVDAADVDIVALQEIECGEACKPGDQLRVLADRLERVASFTRCLGSEDDGYGHALLTRTPATRLREETLPGHPWRASEARSAALHRVETLDGPIHVLSTHLGVSRSERRHQVRALLDGGWLSPGRPLVLLGDLNCGLRSAAHRILGDRLRSVWRADPSDPRRRRATWPSPCAVLALDHIFVTPDLEVCSAEVFRGAGARRASDHLPVVATLSVSRSTPEQSTSEPSTSGQST